MVPVQSITLSQEVPEERSKESLRLSFAEVGIKTKVSTSMTITINTAFFDFNKATIKIEAANESHAPLDLVKNKQ